MVKFKLNHKIRYTKKIDNGKCKMIQDTSLMNVTV